MYCQHCGNAIAEVEAEEVEAEAAAARAEASAITNVADREVEIARINAKRDIDLAKIQRGIIESEVVQEAQLATAEADAVVETLAPEPEPEPEPVVVVNADPDADSAPADDEPPDISDAPAPQKASNPWW